MSAYRCVAAGRFAVAGFSAAGYLTRWQLENRPDLYDGGLDWSGLMITPEVSPLTKAADMAMAVVTVNAIDLRTWFRMFSSCLVVCGD
jgi:hypothetical protein